MVLDIKGEGRPGIKQKEAHKVGMTTQVCNPITQEAVMGLLRVKGQPELPAPPKKKSKD